MSEEHSNFDLVRNVLLILGFFVVAYFISQNYEVVLALTTGYGLVGLFIGALIANATILFPLFVEPILFALASSQASIYDALLLGLIMGIGAGFGEMSGYLIGVLGVSTIKKQGLYKVDQMVDITKKLEKSGMIFIYIGAIIPFPFDLIGVTAGLLKYDFKKFFVAAVLGKTTRYILIAIAGYYSIGLLKAFVVH
ncbi:MAG TPA: VTT domain-containing protein [archaeon]|nr:VTT domain-containing protein [archaeon]